MHLCRTLSDAKLKFKKSLQKEKPTFHKERKNRKNVEYFIGLVSNVDKRPKISFTKDQYGRNVTMDMLHPEQSLLDVKPYWAEEMIYDNIHKEHLRYPELINLINSMPGIKMIYKINSHLVIETDKEFEYFSLKCVNDSDRLFQLIVKDKYKDGDCVFSRDTDSQHRNYLYEHLKKYNLNYDKLKRHFIT